MWRGDLPKLEWREMSQEWWSGGEIFQKLGWRGNVPGVMGVEGRSSKAGVEGKVPLVVTFIITDSMQIDFEVIRCPVNQELLVIN